MQQQTMKTDKLFNFRPLFFMALSLCWGIAFAYFCRYHGASFWWVSFLIPLMLAPFLFCKSFAGFGKTALAVIGMLLFFSIGYGGFDRQVDRYQHCNLYDNRATVVGVIVEKADYDKQTKLILDNLYIDGVAEEGRLELYTSIEGVENLRLADKLSIDCKVATKASAFGDYGFRVYQINDNLCFFASGVKSLQIIGQKADIFLLLRQRIKDALCNGMSEDAAAATMAILTGDTSGIESGLLENMRYGGIAHIFAVSGLHVGALYAFCYWLFQKTVFKRTPKALRFALVAGILVFYAGVCGFSASVIRAVVLCLVAYFAKLLGTTRDSLNTLGAAAILLLLISPCTLFEVGFQLSFTACFGIVLLGKRIGQVCNEGCFALVKPLKITPSGEDNPPSIFERVVGKTTSFIGVTLAAFLGTLPISIYAFGYVSVWGLLLNYLFVPLISCVFAGLLLSTFLSVALTFAAPLLLYLPSAILTALLLIFETFNFSFTAGNGLKVTWLSVVFYYGALSFLTDKWNLSKGWKVALFSLCIIACAVVLAAVNI